MRPHPLRYCYRVKSNRRSNTKAGNATCGCVLIDRNHSDAQELRYFSCGQRVVNTGDAIRQRHRRSIVGYCWCRPICVSDRHYSTTSHLRCCTSSTQQLGGFTALPICIALEDLSTIPSVQCQTIPLVRSVRLRIVSLPPQAIS